MQLPVRIKILNFFRQVFFFPPLEKLLVVGNRGKKFGNLVSKFIPNHYQYPTNSLRTVNRGGINYCLDLSDLVDWYMYFEFLDDSKHTLFNLVQEGDTVLDIGANIGEIGFNLAKKTGKMGQVFSFEPDAFNYNRLVRNYKLNHFPNLELVNKGLGDNPGKYLMRINENEFGNNGSKRIVGAVEGTQAVSNAIEVIRLDDFISEKQIKKIQLIKMDTEGYEMNVLKSATQTIEQFRPIIYTEVQDIKLREFGSSANEMLNFLRSKGYSIANAEDKSPIDSNFNADNCHIDILCIPV
jgi:FkbM family methyltransferase